MHLINKNHVIFKILVLFSDSVSITLRVLCFDLKPYVPFFSNENEMRRSMNIGI